MRKGKWYWFVGLMIVAMITMFSCGAKPFGVSIANKSELSKEWIVGDADRILQISFSSDKYTTENTQVAISSNNSAVVKTEGFTLKATGAGTATITITSGSASDSIEITVKALVLTITYNLGNNTYASVQNATTQVEYGKSFTLQQPVYSGSAEFLGWYVADENGAITEEKLESGKYLKNKSITVIAKWNAWSEVVS